VSDNQERKEKRIDKDELGNTLAGFIEKNRKIIIVLAVAGVVAVLGFAAGMGIREGLQKRGIARVETLLERYEAARFNIAEAEQAEEAEKLLADITGEAKKDSGYAGARAWYLAAQLQADLRNWAGAEESWLRAAKKAGKAYLAPAAWFNAGTAAEEQGNSDAAREHYAKASSYADFPQAARALFSVGRLEETRGGVEAALAAYREITEKWPSTVWSNFANDRIITLSIEALSIGE
jgi:tetratricopeptide (TPR) repeat protein